MKYAEVNKIMSSIATPLSLYLVPSNLESEREKFFESETYNPQFRYRTANKNKGVFRKLSTLEEIVDVDPEISKYILQVIKDKKQASKLLDSIGDNESFLRISEERFGKPSKILFRRACKLLRRRYGDIQIAERNQKLREKMLTYEDLVPIFEIVFSELGLEDWKLDRSKAIEARGFRTTVKTKRVMVDPNVVVNAEKLRKTIVHEVATHALRGNNGFKTGYDVFGKPNLKEYLDDEEGLAMFNEERFGLLREIDIKRRAALVYAMYLGQTMSFRGVHTALQAVYPKKNAFDVVLRVKRGLSDTSKPGCYYKDASYLRGFLKIRRKLAKDTASYSNMYAGKIPLKYLHLVEEGIIPKPKVVPSEELVEGIFKKAKLV